MDLLIMQALSVTTGDAQQASHRGFAYLDQASGRTHTTAFYHMIDDFTGLGL
jgi:hypothetical protein